MLAAVFSYSAFSFQFLTITAKGGWDGATGLPAPMVVMPMANEFYFKGNDGLRSGLKRRHFSIFSVDCSLVVDCGSIATHYRNAIMFWVNFTFANFASAESIAKEKSQ